MTTSDHNLDSKTNNWVAKVKGEAPVYLIDDDGLRHRIWDGPTLESIANWKDVEELASWDELARFPPSTPLGSVIDGNKRWLVKVKGEKDTYLIDKNGIRHRIADSIWLNSLDQRTEVDVFITWNELERFRPGKPIARANANTADQSLASAFDDSNGFVSIRLQHLGDNIHQDLALLKDYENELRYEDDPRRRAKYRREIEQLHESAIRYKQEYEELRTQVVSSSSVAMQEIATQLHQMDDKLNVLLSTQDIIQNDLNDLRQVMLARFDANEQAVISVVLERLDQNQLAIVQAVLDAVEAGHVAENEVQETLIALERTLAEIRGQNVAVAEHTLSTVIKHASETVAAPTFDVKHKLKVVAPIIPMILSYEGEIELGSGLNLEATWQRLIAKVRGGR